MESEWLAYLRENRSDLYDQAIDERRWDFKWRDDEIERLRAALADAIEGMEDMIVYVNEYFREKWAHDDYIERARAALKNETTSH